ncbi:MAG: hypothetical protein LBI18_08315 [Planctomycetaceae bacterium]|jgi:hypothetical protein|nr:hypothetical protein [Planctomycetaceae bacterium]
MNIPRLICHFAAVILIFGVVFVDPVLPQSSGTKQYRKPSESDIEWLLGTSKSQSSNQHLSCNIPPCEPAYSPPLSIAPKQTDSPPQQTVSQISGEIMQVNAQEWNSPAKFSENFFAKVPKNKTTSSPSRNGNSVTNFLSENQQKPVAKSEPKLTPKSQDIQTCSSVADDSDKNDTILAESDWAKKQNINEQFLCNSYGNCDNNVDCCYQICTHEGVPDMIGDVAWISGRSIDVTTQEQSMFFSVPTLLLNRLNLAEHFNAELKNRIWFDYRRLNNATSFNATDFRASRTVDQFMIGLETCLNRCSSVEVRIPFFHQFASKQFGIPQNQFAGSATELGNLSLSFKYLLARSNELTISGGLGVVFPTAEDWRLSHAMLKNKAYYLVPYLGLQWHPNEDVFGHFLVQTDISVSGNELRLSGDTLTINESTMVRLGWQLGRWFYRNELGTHSCRLGGLLELDWTIATDHADNGQLSRDWNNIFIHSTRNKPQSLNIVMGIPALFGQLTITNAVILPITNNHRSFSVGYNFSLSRSF